MTVAFYRQIQGAILVFDLASEKTFLELKWWLDSLQEHVGQPIAKVMVGNKCDIRDREVSPEIAQEVARQHGFSYYETSALTNNGVQEMFKAAMKAVYDQDLKKERHPDDMTRDSLTSSWQLDSKNHSQVSVDNGRKKKKKCCLKFW